MSTAIESLVNREYQYGFVTDIDADTLPVGLTEETVRAISARKNEPDFMLEWRLKAYRRWLTMQRAALGQHHVPPDRLSGDQLLLGAQDRRSRWRASTRSIRSSCALTSGSAFR